MGFNDFWINNNGKKEHLNNAKHGVRKEQMDTKFHNLFDAYDVNGNGTLETEELGGIFKGLTKFAGADKTLDPAENKQVASLFKHQAGINNADFMGFVQSISLASEDIVDIKETPLLDGGKEVETRYKDGSVLLISYYADGDYKFKKFDQKDSTVETIYFMNENYDQKYTKDELEKLIKKEYNNVVAQIKQRASQKSKIDAKNTVEVIPNYEMFRQQYLSEHKVEDLTVTKNSVERHELELSERGQADVAVRDFVLDHYVQTHAAAKEALESMGILDDIGAAINAGAGELWNSIKNVWNGTEEEYQSFYELSKKFEPNYNKALRTDDNLNVMRNNPEMFFRSFETDFKKDMGHQYNLENSVQFQQSTEQYQNAQIMKQRIDILNKAMQEVRMYQSEQDALVHSPAQSEGLNPASHIVNANKLLLQYFNNDQEAVDMILNGTIGNADATIKAISGIKEDTEKLNKAILDGKTFDQIQEDYKSQYKAMYGTDFVPDELTEKVMDAKATGGMVKLAIITIISILITRSPAMAEIMGAAAGSAEASGAAANLVRTLVARYGQAAVQQGIKFAMTSGTLATDVGLTLLNQATSERGVNGEELWESTKGSAKYIFFGAYVGAPMAQAVSRSLGKIGATSRLFEGGTKTVNGAIQTTSISGDKLIQNFVKGGNKVLTTGGALLTDVAAFTGLEVATEGANLKDALSEQGQMLSKLKLMNHVLEYMLGAKAHTATSRANLDAAIEKSGVKNWNIKEIKTPQKTQYIVDIDGLPVGKFEDANQLATAMLERVTANYSELEGQNLSTRTTQKEQKSENKTPTRTDESLNTNKEEKVSNNEKADPTSQTPQRQNKSQESSILQRLETANDRETFVSIRDEIKKLPNGEEKTQLMQAYLKKYNEWSADPTRPSIRMEYKPEEQTQTNQNTDEVIDNTSLTGESIINHLKSLGVDEGLIDVLKEDIDSGTLDLEACKDFFNAVKNDKEFLNDFFGISLFDNINSENAPALLEIYNLLKDSNMTIDDKTGFLYRAIEVEENIDNIKAEININKNLQKYFDSRKDLTERDRKKINYAFKSFINNKGAEFVNDNIDLFLKRWYYADAITPENLDFAKTIEEYVTKTNKPFNDSQIWDMLMSSKDQREQLAKDMQHQMSVTDSTIDKIKQNKPLTEEEAGIAVSNMFSKYFDGGDPNISEIISYLKNGDEVPAEAIELIKTMRDLNKESSYPPPEAIINKALDKTFSTKGSASKEDIIRLNEFIKHVVSNEPEIFSDKYAILKLVDLIKNSEGKFDTTRVMTLFDKGYTVNEISNIQKLFMSYDYDKHSDVVDYEGYNKALDITEAIYDIEPELRNFFIKEFKDAKFENYEEFIKNPKPSINFVEKCIERGIIDKSDYYFERGMFDLKLPLTEVQVEAFNALTDISISNDHYDVSQLCKFLKSVDEVNLQYVKKLNERYGSNLTFCNLSNALNVMKLFSERDNDFRANLVLALEKGVFDGYNNSFVECRPFIDILSEAPEITTKLLGLNADFKSLDWDYAKSFFLGDEEQSRGVQRKPLTQEQTDLVFAYFKNNGGEISYNYTFNDFKLNNKLAELKPNELESLTKAIADNPKLCKYGLRTIIEHKDKALLFLEHEDLIESFGDVPADMFDVVSYEILEKSMSVLNDVPNEVKTKFKDALSKIYIIDVANRIGLTQIRSDLIIEFYKKAVNYEEDIANRLVGIIWNHLDEGLNHIEVSNLDFIANKMKSTNYLDDEFILKTLKCSENIESTNQILTDILANKDKLLKQVSMRCQNTNPEFVKKVEEYINSDDVNNLIFIPNLSTNALANYFFEVSKIFQYVDSKPQDYINGHYEEKIIEALCDFRKKGSEKNLFNSLSDTDKATVEQINETIVHNIDDNFQTILNAISATDIETVKLLLDKRFTIFEEKIKGIDELSTKAKKILSDVIRNGKRINKLGQPDKLTGQQKIDMINLINCATSVIENFDINKYKTPLKKGAFILDSEKLHDDTLKAILLKKGLSPDEVDRLNPENTNWNEKYLSLLYITPARDEGELSDVVKAASRGNFNEFINNPNNKYGQTNLETKHTFESNGVDYEQWLKPDIADVKFEVAGKKCHIRMWDRNPQEDMFLGSKTSCCTALDRTNGGSMAVYMLNTSYNVVELYDNNGEVVGMSRIFIAKVDDKPTIIMDNIELNKEFTKGMDYNVEVKEIRDNFFKYMNILAEKVTGNQDTKVLFYSGDIHVPNKDLTRVQNTIDFLGNIHREEVYVNAVHCSYHNPTKLKDVGDITWLEVPKE